MSPSKDERDQELLENVQAQTRAVVESNVAAENRHQVYVPLMEREVAAIESIAASLIQLAHHKEG